MIIGHCSECCRQVPNPSLTWFNQRFTLILTTDCTGFYTSGNTAGRCVRELVKVIASGNTEKRTSHPTGSVTPLFPATELAPVWKTVARMRWTCIFLSSTCIQSFWAS
ncbi:unnamed protein product [Ectocarpus sp. 12 AP-2014]